MKENINILVAEDDSDINGLLCNILIREGYNVRGTYILVQKLKCA